jgi:hypothetical protein
MCYLIILWGKGGRSGVTLQKVTNWNDALEMLIGHKADNNCKWFIKHESWV